MDGSNQSGGKTPSKAEMIWAPVLDPLLDLLTGKPFIERRGAQFGEFAVASEAQPHPLTSPQLFRSFLEIRR